MHISLPGIPVEALTIPVGLIFLAFGRKLFWLFVAGVGFIAGIHIASETLYGQPGWIVLLVALLAGVGGAVFAVFLQRFAVVLSGFLAGAYLAANLTTLWAWPVGPLLWVMMLFFGIIGAAAAYLFFDWALIVLSALTGAAVITANLPLGSAVSTLLMALLFAVGVGIQAGLLKRDRARSAVQTAVDS